MTIRRLSTLRRGRSTNKAWLTLAATVALLLSPTIACDVCNLDFGKQMETSRADSLIGRDFAKAVQKQGASLDKSGLGSGAFKPRAASISNPTLFALNKTSAPGKTAKSKTAVEGAFTPDAIRTEDASPVEGSLGASLQERFGPTYGHRYGTVPEAWKSNPFIEIIERDYGLPIPATSFVPQDTKPDKTYTIELSEGKAYIGNGVIYDGFLTDGKVPGPLLEADEGDIVELIIKNKGTVPHGASIHSAYTQTSKYLGKINPGDSGRVVFRCTTPGIYMYHCAPGGHAIPMHVLFGQYGMMVVHPKKAKYEMEKIMGHKPDVEVYLIQHEFYNSGKNAVEGLATYTTFNGKLFRYVEDPIKVRPGDFVRINFLNIGPNQISTLHIVGIIWDFVYWQGNPAMAWPGGQSVLAGPSDSWVIDFRIPPDEGAYTLLTHAVGSASRGAIGLFVAEKDVERPSKITPEGLTFSPEEMAEMEKKAVRTISPFKFTDSDTAATFPLGTRSVGVEIIGNSYWPKILEVEPGTKITWTNDDVFTFLSGEFAGIHNATGSDGGDEFFSTPLLAHGETASHVFEKEGTYLYNCTPHPYMKGKIVVKKPEIDLADVSVKGGKSGSSPYTMPLVFGAFLVALFSLFRSGRNK